jgi:hypothetical protein
VADKEKSEKAAAKEAAAKETTPAPAPAPAPEEEAAPAPVQTPAEVNQMVAEAQARQAASYFAPVTDDEQP